MKVEVKAKHIKLGKAGPTECPIALALKDKGCTNIWAGIDIYFIRNNVHYNRNASRKCWKFMHLFDNGKKVKPFYFVLRGIK